MTNINFAPIRDRDVDIVIMHEFYTNPRFAELFLRQVGINNCDIISISHSVMDAALGESDIEVIVNADGKRIALLTENKINAEQQPMQYERYVMRGDKKVNYDEVE